MGNVLIKRIGYGILVILIVVSLIISSSLMYLLVTNHNNLGHVIKVFTLIKIQSIEDISTTDLFEGSVRGMIDALDDPYSVYLDAQTYETLMDRMEGSYGGVGLLITKDEEGRLLVVSPFKGTPAAEAGIASGDVIIKINGEETLPMELDIAASLMQGEPETEVILTVSREGAQDREITIVREIITIPSVDGVILEDTPGIAYLSISMFNDNTIVELQDYMARLTDEGFRGMVLDLRNNPGGSLHSAIDVADVFIPEGPVVHLVGKVNTTTFDARGTGITYPLVVLVNAGSASASEIVAGAIQDTGVGILVGENTFGKGLVQSVFPLDEGGALKLTTAKYLTPNYRDINEKGIEPDHELILTPEELMEALMEAPDPANDPQLSLAIELLLEILP